ncbi:hypothetical protein [Tamaricihabitans halophyticus]|uniref:hypothetical protein n=1 Tax=Tamaricihabitans halophyticus TaxID=1262583 RepID=UPI0010436DD3|nr:hypothetical protein [Tamaricihabitans halophyticus]
MSSSHQEAFLAAWAAVLLPGVGTVARWGELGPYKLLLRLPMNDLLSTAQVPALLEIERADTSRTARHADRVL